MQLRLFGFRLMQRVQLVYGQFVYSFINKLYGRDLLVALFFCIPRFKLQKICIMRQIVAYYRQFSDKRYSTIAGTLVYFLLMSIAPFMLWLTLILGNFDMEEIISHPFFEAVRPLLEYLRQSAQSAAGGAGAILLFSSLYSSTNFFYHLRRSGEIIYESDRTKGGIKLRLSSAVIVVALILCVAVVAAIFIVTNYVFYRLFPDWLSQLFRFALLSVTAFFSATLLNIFACPYKLSITSAAGGSLLTVMLWMLFAQGFSIYLRYADPSQLYGAVAAIIIFLLWCYLMTNSLVIGMIYNGLNLNERRHKTHF